MRIASAKGWLVVGALAAVVVMVLGWTMLISPMRDRTSLVQDEVASQQAANATAQDNVARLKKQSAGLSVRRAQLKALATTIPASEQIPTLLRDISAAAKSAGVTLGELTPSSPLLVTPPTAGNASQPAAVGGLQEVPLAISITGTYAQTQAFLAALESMKRAVLVHGLDLAVGTGGTDATLTTSLRAAVFINPDLGTPSVVPAPAAPAGGEPVPAGTDSQAGTPS